MPQKTFRVVPQRVLAEPPTGSMELAINPVEICALLKALADPLRMEVVQVLMGGERCVCELTETLGLSQSRLSFHLKVMRQAGLLQAREEGRWVYYKLRPEAFTLLRSWLDKMEKAPQSPACDCGWGT